jgi:hypothetical protein
MQFNPNTWLNVDFPIIPSISKTVTHPPAEKSSVSVKNIL